MWYFFGMLGAFIIVGALYLLGGSIIFLAAIWPIIKWILRIIFILIILMIIFMKNEGRTA